MITTIAIILLALAIIINTISIWRVSNKSEHTSYETKHRIDKLERIIEDAQPLIDKYKKERKQNHWKQYNDWKRLYESKYGRCAHCHGEDLEIDTDYKYKAEKYESWYVREIVDYPLSAKYKCNTCGEVISKWQFKEDE
ncbi:hypothetical protein [Staphylococcus gallinarum]|uniref:hypothetical protein n=1 Tax=Staphylococcus gallinarum TaxID=1293 RepID=UPI003F5681E8